MRRCAQLLAIATLLCAAATIAAAAADAAAAAASSTSTTATAADKNPKVQTTTGIVVGQTDVERNVTEFLGIPFAKPPVGDLRWRAPQPAEPWVGERECFEYGPICHAVNHLSPFPDPDHPMSEDCLTINVVVPRAADGQWNDKAKHPVLVYIHGGGFVMGSARHKLISPDPWRLATESKAIYVSFNYRLGPLGFLALEELTQESGTSGVFGLQDQQLALRWVQQNIAAFGGDPASVTIMGESAGGLSICFHLTMPSSTGLFKRAIMQSAPCDWGFMTLEQGHTQGSALVAASPCSHTKTPEGRLHCLRLLDAETAQHLLPSRRALFFHEGVVWFPVIDRKLVPDYPMRLITQGKAQRVDVLLGSNADEGSLFVFLAYPFVVQQAVVDGMVASYFPPEVAKKIDGMFPPSWTPKQRMREVMDDVATCSTLRVARGLAKLTNDSASSEVFVYYFAMAPHTAPFPLNELGASHGIEVRLLYGADKKLDTEEDDLGQLMRHYWLQFVHSGDANRPFMAGQLPHVQWPEFDLTSQRYFTFNATSKYHTHVRSALAHANINRLTEEGRVYEPLTEPDPFALCNMYDTLVDANGNLPAMPVVVEPWWSWTLNHALMQVIIFTTLNKKLLGVGIALVTLLVVSRWLRRRQQTTRKTKGDDSHAKENGINGHTTNGHTPNGHAPNGHPSAAVVATNGHAKENGGGEEEETFSTPHARTRKSQH